MMRAQESSFGQTRKYIRHEKMLINATEPRWCVRASAFVGSYLAGKDKAEAARVAQQHDYVLSYIKVDDKEHWYGVSSNHYLEFNFSHSWFLIR